MAINRKTGLVLLLGLVVLIGYFVTVHAKSHPPRPTPEPGYNTGCNGQGPAPAVPVDCNPNPTLPPDSPAAIPTYHGKVTVRVHL